MMWYSYVLKVSNVIRFPRVISKCDVTFKIIVEFDMWFIDFWSICDFKCHITFRMTLERLIIIALLAKNRANNIENENIISW